VVTVRSKRRAKLFDRDLVKLSLNSVLAPNFSIGASRDMIEACPKYIFELNDQAVALVSTSTSNSDSDFSIIFGWPWLSDTIGPPLISTEIFNHLSASRL